MPAYEIYQEHPNEYNTSVSSLDRCADWSKSASEQQWFTLKQSIRDRVTVCVCVCVGEILRPHTSSTAHLLVQFKPY